MTEQQLLHTLRNVNSKYAAEAAERAALASAAKKPNRRIIPIVMTAAGAAACLGFSVIALMPKNQEILTTASSDISEQLAPESAESSPAEQPYTDIAGANSFASEAAADKTGTTDITVQSAAKPDTAGSRSQTESKQTAAANRTGKKTDAKTAAVSGKDPQPTVIPTSDRKAYVTLPDFTGKSFAEAEALADSLNLSLTKVQRISALPKDTVIDQLTPVGRKVPVGTAIEVETATGGSEVTLHFEIPAAQQKLWDDFEIVLLDKNGKVYDNNFSGGLLSSSEEDYPYGHFGWSLNPATTPEHALNLKLVGTGTVDLTAALVHGYLVRHPATIALDKHPEYAVIGTYQIDYDKKTVKTVSEDIAGAFKKFERTEKPDNVFAIPNFVGMTWKEAQRAADDFPMTLDLFKEETASDQPAGTVVAQNFEAGTEISAEGGGRKQTIVLSVSVGAKKEFSFTLPHENVYEKYPFMDTYPYLANEVPVLNPLNGLDVKLYALDANGKRSGKPESAPEFCDFSTTLWGTGTVDYEAVLVNNTTDEEAGIGTYRIDFDKQTCKLISGDAAKAYKAVTAPLPELTNKTWDEASALAEKAGFKLKKVVVNNALPEGTVTYQPFDADELIAKGNTVPVEVSNGLGTFKALTFALSVPTGYTGTFYISGFKEDENDETYELAFEEFKAEEADGTVEMTVLGCGSGDFKMYLAKENSTKSILIGTYHLDFEKQTAEAIESDMEAAFKKANAE